ncbi:alpha/beta hydrolase [Streptosporangium sp. G11]|uniref:alpha/beta hydrolase n=1 Tax=Streptosporangium sp. G11 TaxID=3436926 RepID=UPI003EBB16C6
MPTTPVVFIHGLWIHSSAWSPWIDLFGQHDYAAAAPGWPGDSDTVAATRLNSAAVADKGIDDIVSAYTAHIRQLGRPPIVIGHSFGGLIAQKLLASKTAIAAVAIDPGQIKGVKPVPFAQVRSGLPVLGNPSNKRKSVSLTKKQFRYSFGNAITQEESDALFDEWTIPGPGKPLFEATAANFSRKSPAAVDTRRGDRGPLLFISGGKDHTVPEKVAKAAFDLYSESPAVTNFKSFPDRGHSLVIDRGWRDIADYTLGWLKKNNL